MHMNKLVRIAAVASVAFSIQAALAADSPKLAKGLLVDAAGRTLYTLDNDRDGKSACSGGCAVAWPPALATGETPRNSDFSILVREDGADQWTFQGKPLYRFAGDAKPGDMNGDALGGVWHAVRGAPRQTNRSERVSPYGY
jgi:predicted lipoprotein with Yx(FWY)xxD motif